MNNNNTTEKKEEDHVRKNEWMIRPCDIYKEEYRDCKSIKARLHQYFVFGETLDCTQWKKDYENCQSWISQKDDRAFIHLVDSETQRRVERLRAHYNNTVWKKRDKPPENWNAPLPEWMQKEFELSYLQLKKDDKADLDVKWCTIM